MKMKMKTIYEVVVALTALAMAAYAYTIAYGFLQETPADPNDALFDNAKLVLFYLVVQCTLSAAKKGSSLVAVIVDLMASSIALLVSGYALFQEQFAHAEALSGYQEQILILIFLAAVVDVVANTLSDLVRLVLTDDMKIVE